MNNDMNNDDINNNETNKPCGPSCQAGNLNLLMESLAKLAKDLKEERDAARKENRELHKQNHKLRALVDALEENRELQNENVKLRILAALIDESQKIKEDTGQDIFSETLLTKVLALEKVLDLDLKTL